MGSAPSIAKVPANAPSPTDKHLAPTPPQASAYLNDRTPALAALLSRTDDVTPSPLPDTPEDELWPTLFREHHAALQQSHRPLATLGPLAAAPAYAPRAAHALRAALHALRGEPSHQAAAEALAFGAELVRALPPRDRAQILGALDGSALSDAEQADIGLAALWQLAARALDVLCTQPLPPALLSAACAVVFAFLAENVHDEPTARDALPPIIERYASPPLVVASLLVAADSAATAAASVDPFDVLRPPAERAPPSTTVRTATAVFDAVSTVAYTLTPRAITNLASNPRLALTTSALLRAPAMLRRGVPPATAAEIRAASDALCLLATLVSSSTAYRDSLLGLRDGGDDQRPSFRSVYSALCYWAQHPAAAILTETLLSSNRKFRAYSLSRTDPETLLVPLLRALFQQCAPSEPPADSYALAASLLVLTWDRGFCAAIDDIIVPPSTLSWADPRGRLGNVPDPSLSALVLFVGSRCVQQSLLSKREPPQTYTASLALAAMANVASETSTLQAPIADRLVSLLDFLGRRVRRAAIVAGADGISEPPGVLSLNGKSHTHNQAAEEDEDDGDDLTDYQAQTAEDDESQKREGSVLLRGGRERSACDVHTTLRELAGLALEIVCGVLRSNGDVSANRHLVYALLHREYLVKRNGPLAPLSAQCGALCARLERVVRYFASQVEAAAPAPNTAENNAVLSVETVFSVIDQSARLLPPELLGDLPPLKFEYRADLRRRDEFMCHASWAVVERLAPSMAKAETQAPGSLVHALQVESANTTAVSL